MYEYLCMCICVYDWRGCVYVYMCMLIYVCVSTCVYVCECVHVQFCMKTNVKRSDSDNCTFSSVSASAALLEQQLMTDSLRNENDMEAVSEVDNNLSRNTVLQIDTVN